MSEEMRRTGPQKMEPNGPVLQPAETYDGIGMEVIPLLEWGTTKVP